MIVNHFLINFLSWFFGALFLSWLLDRLWVGIFAGRRRIHRIFVTPGIIVHELSHALACLLMRAKIHKISFFASSGGYVNHGKPRIRVIGLPIISLAPLAGAGLALLGLTYLWQIDVLNLEFNNFLAGAWEILQLNYARWQFWIFLYLVASVATAVSPSAQDFKNSLWSLLFIGIVLGFLVYFQFGLNSIEWILTRLSQVLFLGVLLELVALVITLPFLVLKRIF